MSRPDNWQFGDWMSPAASFSDSLSDWSSDEGSGSSSHAVAVEHDLSSLSSSPFADDAALFVPPESLDSFGMDSAGDVSSSPDHDCSGNDGHETHAGVFTGFGYTGGGPQPAVAFEGGVHSAATEFDGDPFAQYLTGPAQHAYPEMRPTP
eukprot:COSAG01_NODE_36241_length_520_cov_0.995249_1_plen_149_part_10